MMDSYRNTFILETWWNLRPLPEHPIVLVALRCHPHMLFSHTISNGLPPATVPICGLVDPAVSPMAQ